jgi:hypothetical protein
MECFAVRRLASAYLDDAISGEERSAVIRHLSSCRECALESKKYSDLRQALRSLPRRTPPPDLAVRLRVAASKVRAESATGAGRWGHWRDYLQLTLRNLMRPVALPAIGGLCSAVFLFSSLVPAFQSAFAAISPGDVPTMLTTQPLLKCTAPIAFGDDDAVVDLQLDDQGRIVSYTIVSVPGQQSEQLRRNIENNLLFTEFWPATSFGHGVAGTVRISFRTSRIDVRG